MEEFDAFFEVSLKGLAARYETASACPFIDNGGANSLREIVFAGRSAGIDQSSAACVAVEYLIAGEVDRMIAGEICINEIASAPVGFANGVGDGFIAAVCFR